MKRFATLLDTLIATSGRNAKIRLLADYFSHTPDPDRGWGLTALTGGLDFPVVKPAMIREAVEARVDPVLFRFSYDYVGDLAETVALMWPDPEAGAEPPALTDIVETLRTSERGQAASLITGSLNVFDAPTRWAFLKLITGGLRVGVSARLAKTALATLGPHSVEEIEEVWHGVRPPYSTLLAWAEGSDHRPKTEDRLVFRSLMLASPLVEPSLATLDPAAFVAEWKWDGVRPYSSSRGTVRPVCSHAPATISAAASPRS